MKRFTLLPAVAGVFLIAACQSPVQRAGDTQLETLYGIGFHPGQISVLVDSNGCTDASSFNLQVDEHELHITRTSEDLCRRKTFRTWIKLPSRHTGILTLANPFSV